MAANYVLLETINLTQSSSSVTFDNIPQTGYTDLKLVMSARNDGAQYYGEVYFNGTTTGYSRRMLYGDGSSAGSLSASNDYTLVTNPTTSYTANTFGNFELHIPNYTSNANKSFSVDAVIENNATLSYAIMYAGLWSNTAAITSITLDPDSGNFVQYSTFSLYGLAAVGTTPVIAPKASGGDIVANDGTYWYHAFLTSGYFTPQTSLSCDILQIAGGGAGGYNVGGGGGAGGLLAFTAQSLTTQGYPVAVGAGGAGVLVTASQGNGSSSQFGTLTASVGGGGGGSGSGAGTGATGGSGGGGSFTTGGSATSGQGYAGGTGIGGGSFSPGGGGGAGAVGANQSGRAGAGGAGLNTWSAWATATNTGVSGYFAGGGGGGGYAGSPNTGGAGGAGGGGTGSNYNIGNGTNGIANTGGGGGGGCGGANAVGKQGGSGIVLVRYLMA